MAANPAAGDLFNASLMPSVIGAVWVWLLAVLLGAAVAPLRDRVHAHARILVWAVLGVALQTHLWLMLGFLEWLWPSVVLGVAGSLTLLAAALGGPRLLREVRDLGNAGSASGSSTSPAGQRWVRLAAWSAVGFFGLLVLRLALWPTVFYDDLVYHLGVPRQALLTGSWPAMPGLHYSFMPAGWDAAYLLPLALGGGSGPQLMNVVTLALFVWAVYRLARHGGAPDPAAAATALLVIAPVIGSLGAFAGNDLFVALALCVAAERLLSTSGDRPWVVGLVAGAAWAAKYAALPACAGLALAAAWLRRGTWRHRLTTALTAGIASAAVALAWTLRSWVLTGNPVYPAFYGILGGKYWDAASDATLTLYVSHGGLDDRGLAAFGLGISDLVFRSGELGQPSGANMLFALLGLFGVLLLKRVCGGVGLLVVWIVAYLAWCATSLNLRYALILLVLLAPFTAALIESGSRYFTRVARGATGPLVATLLVLAVMGPFADTVRRHLRLYGPDTSLFGGTPRHEIHATRLHLAAAGQAMVRQLPPDARILLVGEGRVALLPRPALASSGLDRPDIARLVAGTGSIDEVNGRLVDFTHVVVNYRELKRFRDQFGFAQRFPPEEWRLFESWLSEGLVPLARYGTVVVYGIPNRTVMS